MAGSYADVIVRVMWSTFRNAVFHILCVRILFALRYFTGALHNDKKLFVFFRWQEMDL